MLAVSNISKSFGNKTVLEGVSFNVERGDVFGYLGPKGAGKTTTIKTILGLYKPDSGAIKYNGVNIGDVKNRPEISVCFKEEGLHEDLTGYENMELQDRFFFSKEGRQKRIENLLELFNLTKEKDELVAQYSLSMRKRLAIARALLNRPKLLILDEPTEDLSPDGQLALLDILARLDNEVTILLSSHNLGLVQKLCNKVAIINKSILYSGLISNKDNSSLIEFVVGLHNTSIDRESLLGLIKAPIAWCKLTNKQFVFAVDKCFKEKVLMNLLNNHLSMVEMKSHSFDLVELYRSVVREES